MERALFPTHGTDRHERARADLFEHLTPDELAENMQAVIELRELPVWSAVQDALRREADSIMRELVGFPSPRVDVAEYERRLGEIRGIERVDQILDGMIVAAEEASSG